MNLTQITERNRKMQRAATRISELMPGGKIVMMSSDLTRSLRRMDTIFPKLLEAKTEVRFGVVLDKMEEEIDDAIYTLDRLAEIYKQRKYQPLGDFVQLGYDLMSIYSMGCDKIIALRVKEEEH